jgi:hypothetical protein
MRIRDFAKWDLEYYLGKIFSEDLMVRLFGHLPPTKPSSKLTIQDIYHWESINLK